MKNNYFQITCLFLFISLTSCNSDDSFTFFDYPTACTTVNTFVGDVHLKLQSEVDDFVQNGYCLIDGNLTIGDNTSQPSDIVDLSGLSTLQTVNGFLRIRRNSQLPSLNGLENVTYIGGYLLVEAYVMDNLDVFQDNTFVGESIFLLLSPQVTSMGSFKDITELDHLSIHGNNSSLDFNAFSNLKRVNSIQLTGKNTNMQGLNNLERVEDAFWVNGGNLQSYEGLDALEYVGGRFWIYQNPHITDLSGLESLETVGLLEVSDNPNLQSLSGIENLKNSPIGIDIRNNPQLTSLVNFSNNITIGEQTEGNGIAIRNNDALTTLSGLQTITSFTGLVAVHENDNLRDLCDLQNILSLGTLGVIRIELNLHNPSQTDIENGVNCNI